MGETVNASTSHVAEPSSLSIGEVFEYLRRRLLITIGIPAVCLAVGVAVIFISEPIYRSEAVILPISDEESGGQLARLAGQFGGLASLAGINVSGTSSASASLATLRSKNLIARFIEQEDLLPELYRDDWNAKARAWLDEPPDFEKAVKLFDEKIRTVFEDKDTGLITVRVEWRDPSVASAWSAKLVAMADEDVRLRDVKEAQASMAFLEKELQATSTVELQQAIYSLMESETKKIMLARVRPEYTFRIIDPPRTPDADDPVWPNTALVIAVSLLLGLALDLFIAVLGAGRRVGPP